MAFKDLKTALLLGLRPRLDRSGFKMQKAKEQFVRSVDVGRFYFLLDFAEYQALHVQPTVRVRVDAVEEVFHRTSGFEKKYQPDTPTIAVTLQNLARDPLTYEYVVGDPADVGVVIDQLESDFDKVALPYFERYSDLRMIDVALNENPEADSVHYLMDYLRCAHGLIVARMVGRPNYRDLVEVYRRKLAQISNGFYLPKFEALVADLEKY
jgi:hypothetical protein